VVEVKKKKGKTYARRCWKAAVSLPWFSTKKSRSLLKGENLFPVETMGKRKRGFRDSRPTTKNNRADKGEGLVQSERGGDKPRRKVKLKRHLNRYGVLEGQRKNSGPR